MWKRALAPREPPLTDEARALLVSFADAIEAEQAPGKSLAHVTGYASKPAEQAGRIAGALTLCAGMDAPAVTGQCMGPGIALSQYYLSEAIRLADAATVSQKIDRAETLQKRLLENRPHDGIAVRVVVRLGPNALRESPKARAALDVLERHGWLVRRSPETVVRGAARKEAWRTVKGGGDVD